MTVASPLSMRRNSDFSVIRLISATAPASSVPVGPAPTMTNVNSRCRSRLQSLRSARSKAM